MMNRLSFGFAVTLSLVAFAPVRAEEIPENVQKVIDRGLDWLDHTQHRDGHWDANGSYPTTMTAMGGMAMLMEGSNLREGKYSSNVRRATEWLMDRAQSSG